MLHLSRKEIVPAALSTFGNRTIETYYAQTQDFIKCSKQNGRGSAAEISNFKFFSTLILVKSHFNLKR